MVDPLNQMRTAAMGVVSCKVMNKERNVVSQMRSELEMNRLSCLMIQTSTSHNRNVMMETLKKLIKM